MIEVKGQKFEEGDAVVITTTRNENNIGFVNVAKNKYVKFVWWILSGFKTPAIVIGMGKNTEKQGFQEQEILEIKKLRG